MKLKEIFNSDNFQKILIYFFIILIILTSIYIFFSFYTEIFLTLIFIMLVFIYRKIK